MSEGDPIVESDQLRLVRMSVDQAAALVEGGPIGLPYGPGWPHADTFDGVRMAVSAGDPAALPWLVLWRETATDEEVVVGDVGCKGSPTTEGEIEIGYGLAAPYRGRGIGTRVVRAYVEWLRTQPDVAVITAETELGNLASRRLLERLGFTLASDENSAAWYELAARSR
jgi:RimJ/RimL family protein N-acetyltransferase